MSKLFADKNEKSFGNFRLKVAPRSLSERGAFITFLLLQNRGNKEVYKEQRRYDERNYRYVYDAYGNPIHSVEPNPDGSTSEVTSEYKLVYIPFPLSEQILELGLIQAIPSAE